MGTLFILLLTSACFTDFQRVNDKNGLVKEDLQYGGTKDSGGVLNSLQARFDMQYLELELKILPASKSIEGSALLDAVSYTHLRAHETREDLVLRHLL